MGPETCTKPRRVMLIVIANPEALRYLTENPAFRVETLQSERGMEPLEQPRRWDAQDGKNRD